MAGNGKEPKTRAHHVFQLLVEGSMYCNDHTENAVRSCTIRRHMYFFCFTDVHIFILGAMEVIALFKCVNQPFSPFLTISLCRAGQYFSHKSSIFDLVPCLQSVGISSGPPSCVLPLHLFFGRPLLLLPETSSFSDFAHIRWLRSRLKQWPNHFSLLFSRKVSTGFTCASFLMS